MPTFNAIFSTGLQDVQTEYQKFLTGYTGPTGSTAGEGPSAGAEQENPVSFGGARTQSEFVPGMAADKSAALPGENATRDASDPWMAASGGVNGMSEAHLQSAQRSYARWAEHNPQLAAKHHFGDYVDYVQGKWAEKNQTAEAQTPEQNSRISEPKIQGPDIKGPEIKAPDGAAAPAAGQVQAPSTEPQPSPGSQPSPVAAVTPQPSPSNATPTQGSYVHAPEL